MLLNNKSRSVAFGGIFTALSVLFLLLSNTIPFGRLIFVFLASAMIGIAVNMSSKKLALFVYIATSVLSIFVLPDKAYAVLYAVVVGNYPIIKIYAEKIKKNFAVFLVKLILFNVYMLICYGIAVNILNLPMNVQYPIQLLWVMMLAVFCVYDYAYTLFMQKIYYAIPKNLKEKNYENRN